jgi:hypothetical protein
MRKKVARGGGTRYDETADLDRKQDARVAHDDHSRSAQFKSPRSLIQAREPLGDLPERGQRIRQSIDANIVELEGLTKLSEMPFDSGLCTGIEQGTD